MKRIDDCEGSLSFTRRQFLGAGAALTFAAWPGFAAGDTPTKTRLLVILLRGGMDGLFAMPPVGDDELPDLRKNLAPENLQDLDGFFALHETLQNVHQAYADGNALLVHAASLPYTGRSHFEGQDIMESGVMRPYASPTGWLGRALDITGYSAALTMTLPVPLVLRGRKTTDTLFPTWISGAPAGVYDGVLKGWTDDADLAGFGAQMQAEGSKLGMATGRRPGNDNSLDDLARSAAKRLKADDGPRVAVLDHVGFDTHASQPGQHADRLREIDAAIGAFRKGMGPVWSDTLVVTVTEFGRTAAENGSWGTDHGWATAIFLLGGRLKKSGIVADWPGLEKKSLFEGRDLKATIDARSLYGAVVSSALGIDPERVRKDVIEYERSPLFDEYLA
jgi:uncharacterized protein (DUF1501 family)